MTFRDSGLYANLGFAHGSTPAADGVTSLLPAERAASDESPWSFYIFQYNAREKGPSEAAVRLIRQMAANGKKVILRVALGDAHHSLGDLQRNQDIISLIFTGGIDPDWLYAITLGEENVYWNNSTPVLTDLYHWCKQNWPDLPVYQWWTPMEVPNVRSTTGWVALPADGWVIDLYLMERREFERRVVKTLETGKPMIHIVWSSPTWMLYHQGDHNVETWWDAVGKPSFDDQIEVCRSYNIPVAHFVTQPGTPRKEDGTRGEPIRWAWHATDPQVRAFYIWLETFARNLKHIPETSFGYRKLDKALFDWAHTRPEPQKVVFETDDEHRQTVTLKYEPRDLARRPGRHELNMPVDLPGVKIEYMLSDGAAALSETWQLPNRQGGVNRAVMDLLITDVRTDALHVEVDVTADRNLGGGVSIAYSPDGQTWSEAVKAQPDGKPRQKVKIVIPDGVRQAEQPLRVRLTFTAGAGVETKAPAMQLHELSMTRIYETLTVDKMARP